MKILPLMVDHRPDGSIEIQKADGVPVAVMCYSAASAQNAEEICNRVNCHDELVAALEGAAEWLNDMGCEHETELEGLEDDCVVCIVNSALAKAKPGGTT